MRCGNFGSGRFPFRPNNPSAAISVFNFQIGFVARHALQLHGRTMIILPRASLTVTSPWLKLSAVGEQFRDAELSRG